MRTKKLLIGLFTLGLAITGLTGCGKDSKEIIVGAMAVPGQEILEAIKEDFESKGYKLTIQTYTSFDLVNPPLANGSNDANLFQHQPYMDTYNKTIENSTEYEQLYCAQKLYLPIYGVYSKHFASKEALPSSGNYKAYVPTDVSNQSRSLYILHTAGIITLDATKVSSNATVGVADVIDNKGLTITTMEASLIASAIFDDDCALGVVNGSYAIPKSLGTTTNMIAQEQLASKLTNANILAIKAKDKDEQWVKDLVECLTSKKCEEFIQTKYGSVIEPVWDVKE